MYEGTSTYSRAHAKSAAPARFKSYLVGRLLAEYAPLWIRYDTRYPESEFRDEIDTYVNTFMNKHPSLMEYITGPDPLPGLHQVYVMTARARWMRL